MAESCECGATLRVFWVWRDANQVLHASSFKPTSGELQAMIAATSRDALLPMTGGRAPKHDVRDAANASAFWPGRCSIRAIPQAAI